MPRVTIQIIDGEYDALVRPASTEVRGILWSLEEGKTPGLDGFSPLFCRRYWPIVGEEMTDAIQLIFASREISVQWKRTMITFILKKSDTTVPGYFRPISLCTILYKVCAKVLIRWLQPVILQLISQEQRAFVSGHSISDNILLAQKFMHDL